MTTLVLSGAFPVLGQSLVRVSGEDAEKFLHGQFTNSMMALAGKCRLAAYCSPKGRMLADFLAWRDDEAFYLLMPSDIVEGFVKRLRMYVLRAKVVIETVNPTPKLTVFLGRAGEAALEAMGEKMPQPGAAQPTTSGTLLGLAPMTAIDGLTDGAARALLAQSEGEAGASAAFDAWTASQIAAGVAEVTAATKEAYVPQHVNYERAGGVIFTKGCYPGQEVISRVEHIGKTNRRAAIGVLALDEGNSIDAAAMAGKAVFADAEECGTVVEAARVGDQLLVLFSATVDAIEGGQAISLEPNGPALAAQALPYALSAE